ncbi:hypothetical protein CAMGR0001_1568 [Campylobacter gracilis RM3268]|uniref:Uncharacterized protein n=1 Tax=Campylobacter gracilis RM3268 TaxID=553220 RepID=C8PK16_9BACT|nr:hypothetical protein CAMGR0001_1568 [Campylobacter gracilis RM3268]
MRRYVPAPTGYLMFRFALFMRNPLGFLLRSHGERESLLQCIDLRAI